MPDSCTAAAGAAASGDRQHSLIRSLEEGPPIPSQIDTQLGFRLREMCIAVWLWQSHPVYPLLLLLNRDEFHGRPTEPAGWWGEGGEKILGGRDGLARGTWMGCTKDGKVAFITNFREPDSLPGLKSRGDLPVRFLQSKKTPEEFADDVVKEAEQYNGFNLIIADLSLKVMVYVSNRPKGEPAHVQIVSPGLHVLSNAKLDTPWYKAERLRNNFKELLKSHVEKVVAEEMVKKLMEDSAKAPRGSGHDSDWEFERSSIFVETDTKLGRYGTRSMIALFVKANGEISFYERYLEGSVWKEHTLQYHIKSTY